MLRTTSAASSLGKKRNVCTTQLRPSAAKNPSECGRATNGKKAVRALARARVDVGQRFALKTRPYTRMRCSSDHVKIECRIAGERSFAMIAEVGSSFERTVLRLTVRPVPSLPLPLVTFEQSIHSRV